MSRSYLPSIFGTDKNPPPLFTSLHKEIDRVFDEFRRNTPRLAGEGLFVLDNQIVPKLDVSETDKEVEITVELPGVKEEDLDISAYDNVLVLKGEKSASREEKKKDYRLVERSYGSFARSVPLDFPVDPDSVKADFQKGVLTITIAKPPEVAEKTRKIKIGKSH